MESFIQWQHKAVIIYNDYTAKISNELECGRKMRVRQIILGLLTWNFISYIYIIIYLPEYNWLEFVS